MLKESFPSIEESVAVSPISTAHPGHNGDFLARLDQLANAAARIRDDAMELVVHMEDKADSQLRHLKDGLLPAVTGQGEVPIDTPQQKKEIQLFWNALSTLAAAQFSAFALENRRTTKALLDQVAPALSDRAKLFWDTPAPEAKPAAPYARFYVLLALYSMLLPRAASEGGALKGLEEQFAVLLQRMNALVESSDKASKSEQPGIETAMWQAALLKLAGLVSPRAHSEHHARVRILEESLHNKLALKLQAGARRRLPVVLISDLVGILGGRFLNPTQRIEPDHAELYVDSVKAVLGTERSSWVMPSASEAAASDPLLFRYSPLAFVLVMPNQILRNCLSELASVTAGVIRDIRDQLSRFLVHRPQTNEEVQQAVNILRDAIMIGTVVADRFRDLVAEEELNRLGAEVPPDVVPWKDVTDSLDFRTELESGIALWKTRSKNRPGAILVFGPPGTGKTTIAKAFLRKLNEELRSTPGTGPLEDWRFLALSPANFARDGSQFLIASAEALFRCLQRVRRCVVLLDEMEEFLRSRGAVDATLESRLITTAFLPLLQDTVDKREIILIVATNYVGTIDSAVTRRGRFDMILPLGPPDLTNRENIVRDLLSGPETKKVLQPNRISLIADYAMGYSHGEILDFVAEISRADLLRLNDSELTLALWKLRNERVPVALSGAPGCDWRKFDDEAARFRRPWKRRDDRYWEEPKLPKIDDVGVGGHRLRSSPVAEQLPVETPRKTQRTRRRQTSSRSPRQRVR